MSRHSRFDGAGYLISDNSASDWGTREEDDVVCCAHCQAVVRKRQWVVAGGYCSNCDAPLCKTCADALQQQGCQNFMRKIDEALRDHHRREQNARLLGI